MIFRQNRRTSCNTGVVEIEHNQAIGGWNSPSNKPESLLSDLHDVRKPEHSVSEDYYARTLGNINITFLRNVFWKILIACGSGRQLVRWRVFFSDFSSACSLHLDVSREFEDFHYSKHARRTATHKRQTCRHFENQFYWFKKRGRD